MKLSTITRAIAYHTQEGRLGFYIKTAVRYAAMAICFIYALGVTARVFYENVISITLQIKSFVVTTYISLSNQAQRQLDAYHFSNDVKEGYSATQVSLE